MSTKTKDRRQRHEINSARNQVPEKRVKLDHQSTGSNVLTEGICNTQEQFLNLEEAEKFSGDFKISYFRKKLRGCEFISELRQFLHYAKVKPRIIWKYFEKKGKPLELVEALERIDKSNLQHVSYICQALQIVLMHVLIDDKSHTESAVNASRYFLNNYGQVVERLLRSPNVDHRKYILKLLTAIVCLEPHLGRQILNFFDTFSNTKSMEELISYSKTEKNESESVRKCFIHFLLSYIIDGNSILIRNVLDKYNLMSSLFWGLVYDDHITACVVLNTLTKNVLKCLDISKTKKVHIFDFANLKHIIKLYQWKGPQANVNKLNKQDILMENNIDPNERKAVAQAAHDFLVMLLTSRKYGIAFDAVSNFRQKHNIIQSKILINLESPWKNELKSELVIKILKACPELAKKTVKRYSIYLSPNKSTNDWECVANFIEKLILQLHPSNMGSALEKITVTDYTFWIKDICLCSEALINLKGMHALNSNKYSIRIATVKLLLAMFQQFCNYMNALLRREKLKGNDLRKFKFDILNHVFINFPTIQNIFLSLYKSIKSEDLKTLDILYHLEVTLDLILIIAKNCRSFVDKTGAIVDYIEILHPLYEFQTNEDYAISLELKAVKAILLLLPKSLNPKEEHFNHVIQSFINAFVHGKGANQKEAGCLLRKILSNSNLFENAFLEIDLWLEALKFVRFECLNRVKMILPNILKIENPVKIDSGDESDDVVKNFTLLFTRIEKGVIQNFVDKPALSKLFLLFHNYVNKSNDSDETKYISEYLDVVSLLLFHYLPYPKIVQKIYNQYHKTYNNYMLSWLDKSEPGVLHCENIPKFSAVYNSILAKKINFTILFGCSKDHADAVSFKVNEKEVILNKILNDEKLILIYIQEVIFILVQLVKNSMFDEDYSQSCFHYLTNFFEILLHLREKEEQMSHMQDVFSGEIMSYLEYALKYIYCDHFYLLQSFNILTKSSSEKAFLNFMCDLTECVNSFKLNNFHELNVHYRVEITNQIISSINTCQTGQNFLSQDVIKILEVFQMSREDCVAILKKLSDLTSNFFITDCCIYYHSLYLDIMAYILKRLVEFKHFKIDTEIIVKIIAIYTEIVKNPSLDINFDKLTESLHGFLIVSWQSIPHIPKNTFHVIYESQKVTKSTVKLVCLLLERRSDFTKAFKKTLPIYITKRELTYPLLNIIISKKGELEMDLANALFQEYRNGFLKTIEKPQKAGVIYKENVAITLHLIERCMPTSECIDFCHKNLKIDVVEVFQLKVIEMIYRKGIESSQGHKEEIFINYLHTLIQLFLVLFRKGDIDYTKVETLCFMAYDWVKKYRTKMQCDFNKILSSQFWPNFCKNCLKIGMQIVDCEVGQSHKKTNNSIFLKILSFFCDIFYKNFCDLPDVEKLFEMVICCSSFLDIALTQQPTQVKTELMHLLYILVQKNRKMLDHKHIPIFLGAYQAKLSLCDRYVLALLQFYEQNGISLYEYRPLIWGESAVIHYSLKQQDEKTYLKQEEPSISKVMSLIDRQVSDFTLANFPVWRKLNTLLQVPEIMFIDPNALPANLITNSLEIEIETCLTNSDKSYLSWSMENDTFDECYDPAFIIPMMSMAFAPGMYSHPVYPIQNGLLAITFAALSSQDKEMRLAAGCVQLRYRQHFENSVFFDKPLWIQAYNNVQNGLDNLSKDWLKHKRASVPRVPYISCLFLARSINILMEPTNSLYKVLTMFLRLKNAFNFLNIPEFNVLFHSSEMEHQTFRHFILQVIRDGIKNSSDIFLLVSTNTFKSLQSFYGSTISNLEINLLILSIINTCCKIPASIKLIIEQVGVIPWLDSIIENVEYFHFDTIESIISIISNMWYSVKSEESDFHNFRNIQTSIFYLLIKLSKIISGRISLVNFATFLNILCKTVQNNHKEIGEDVLDKILNCAERHFEDHLWYINNIKINGVSGIESEQTFVKYLKNSGLCNISILGLLCLRNFVAEWVRI